MKMNHLRSYALGIAAGLMTLPMSAATQPQQQDVNLVSASAQLVHGLNTKSAHVGQVVMAKLTSGAKANGHAELPSGTMLMGKVTHLQNSKGNQTQISVVFNEARLSNGSQVPIKATLLAAYPPVVIGITDDTNSDMIVQPRLIRNDQTTQQNTGTLGNVMLKSAVQSEVSGVFLSKDHNFNLDRGTRLQLAIAPETTSGSTANGS